MSLKPFSIAGIFVLAMLGGIEGCGQHTPNEQPKMDIHAPHPGVIRMIDDDTDSVRLVKADDVPLQHRFVYLDQKGLETDADDSAAIERIPVVEVRMTPTDGDGHIVPRTQAKLIRIKESGPDNRILRSTTMRKN